MPGTTVQIIDYNATSVQRMTGTSGEELARYRSAESVSWLNLNSVEDADAVKSICGVFNIHPLWIEDILDPETRPRCEWMGDRMLVTVRMVLSGSAPVQTEQVSLVMGPGWVLTVQERPGDVWASVRNRIQTGSGRIRRAGADYLMHALIDTVVDNYFIALEELEDRVDAIEEAALTRMEVDLKEVYTLKEEVRIFQQVTWPMREVTAALLRDDGDAIHPETRPFFRDLSDHVLRVKDEVKSSQERVMGIFELHLAVNGHRLNEIMRVLTVVSTVFIPLTFLVGVYGMNFHHMPELDWRWSYPLFWVVSAVLAGSSWVWFKRKGWL